MGIRSVFPAADMLGIARRKKSPYQSESVALPLVESRIAEGWALVRSGKRTARISREKQPAVWLEDRTWTLFYRMGFRYLSGDRGASLDATAAGEEGPNSQIDVVAIDDEVAIAVECKSARVETRRNTLQADIAKHGLIRQAFTKAVAEQLPSPIKRTVVLAFFTENLVLSSNDRQRANDQGIALFDARDLAYYQALVAHLGPAARYQFLADLLAARRIPGLALRVPAVRTKMGGYRCYTFSASPEYLLKISYVSHRAKGKASDVDTYQRMLQRSRLKKIRDYISRDGIFPTNIVVNFDQPGNLRFERTRQEGTSGQDATYGWLDLPAHYKSAWIIDGQHRLFAYSGHPRSRKSLLAVLAFDGLPPSKQAQLFIDINAEQKSVKQTLLQELYAELHWEAADPRIRARAIVSKAIQVLDDDPDSPFLNRILKADEKRTDVRCISLASLFQALNLPGVYVVSARRGEVTEYGPFWAGDNDATLVRTTAVVSAWFNAIRERSVGWWDLGSADGGGLAMNDGVSICFDVLRSVLAHLDGAGHKLVRLRDPEVVELLTPFATALGDYLGRLSPGERKAFRDLRGNQGHAAGLRRCQAGIQRQIHDFSPPGLQEALDLERAQTGEQARETIILIEKRLQEIVLTELKAAFGEAEQDWFFRGVPKTVRKQVDDRINEDRGERGGRSENLDLIHYREIALANWQLFEGSIAFGKGSKDRRTGWIVDVNEIRKSAMHASRATPITFEQVDRLKQYLSWLRGDQPGEQEVDWIEE